MPATRPPASAIPAPLWRPALVSLALVVAALVPATGRGATPAETAARALVGRVLPALSPQVDVEQIAAAADGSDVFEVESRAGRLVLRGNTAVSIASGLAWYLTHVAHLQLSWDGDNLAPPASFPLPTAKVRVVAPYRDRAYLNYCTFNYTMAWWGRGRWEREIDWMALHGVTMPLATTGEEAVWQATLRQFGMGDNEIRQYLVGPAFSCWQWLTNIEAWAGPLPQAWIDSHLELGRFILQRERELGMTPILQGFSGCVPLAFARKFPAAAIQRKAIWCAVPPGTAQIDPEDPLFGRLGRVFLEQQARLLGPGHLYAADPFHEGEPPQPGDTYLTAVGQRIYGLTQAFDPEATLVMQGWSIREGVVRGIPADRLLVLDLTGEKWRETQAFWGRPWVAGVLHNFGGRTFLGGNLPALDANAPSLLGSPAGGRLVGIGAFPEATQQNPVVYDLAFELGWQRPALDLPAWVEDYARARYGRLPEPARAGWSHLLQSVYAQADPAPAMDSPICAQPAVALDKASPWGSFDRDYDPAVVWTAWDEFLAAGREIGTVDTYQYDLVDVGRQALADLSVPLYAEVAAAYRSGDLARFRVLRVRFLDLIDDLDTLVGTRREFLLGRWLADARGWGTTAGERDLYERNARLLLTVWGPPSRGAYLEDYACRQWSGLLRGYYRKRWERFFAYLDTAPPGTSEEGLYRVMDRPGQQSNEFYRQLADWEYSWCDEHDHYPAKPAGDPLAVSKRLAAKWRPAMLELYPSFAWKKSPAK